MGRVRAFDTAEAVRAARAVFWERGFDGASLPELEQATGLSRSSIYHAFGSKRGLFDAAVASYLDEVVRPRLRPLTEVDVSPEALDAYFTGLRDAILNATSPTASGCLLLNTACSPLGNEAEVSDVVTAYLRELESALASGVRAKLPHASRADQDLMARACTGMVAAAFTLARANPAEAAAQLDAARGLVAAQA